jgi:hypothetical protein
MEQEKENPEGTDDARENGAGDKAFDDVTDIKNEDFIYVY